MNRSRNNHGHTYIRIALQAGVLTNLYENISAVFHTSSMHRDTWLLVITSAVLIAAIGHKRREEELVRSPLLSGLSTYPGVLPRTRDSHVWQTGVLLKRNSYSFDMTCAAKGGGKSYSPSTSPCVYAGTAIELLELEVSVCDLTCRRCGSLGDVTSRLGSVCIHIHTHVRIHQYMPQGGVFVSSVGSRRVDEQAREDGRIDGHQSCAEDDDRPVSRVRTRAVLCTLVTSLYNTGGYILWVVCK